MNSRRKFVLVLFLVLLIVPATVLSTSMGSVEVGIWFFALVACVVAFFTWAKPRATVVSEPKAQA